MKDTSITFLTRRGGPCTMLVIMFARRSLPLLPWAHAPKAGVIVEVIILMGGVPRRPFVAICGTHGHRRYLPPAAALDVRRADRFRTLNLVERIGVHARLAPERLVLARPPI